MYICKCARIYISSTFTYCIIHGIIHICIYVVVDQNSFIPGRPFFANKNFTNICTFINMHPLQPVLSDSSSPPTAGPQDVVPLLQESLGSSLQTSRDPKARCPVVPPCPNRLIEAKKHQLRESPPPPPPPPSSSSSSSSTYGQQNGNQK